SAGDSVTASLLEESSGVWQVVFTDNTTGKTYQTSLNYDSSKSSVEWIEESPSTTGGALIPLDNFGTINFTAASAVVNGSRVSLGSTNAQPLTMVNGQDQALATPSLVGADGASFSVVRSSAASSSTFSTTRTIRVGRGKWGRVGEPTSVIP